MSRVAKRREISSRGVIELAKELNVLEPQRVYKSSEKVYHDAECVSDYENQHREHYSHVRYAGDEPGQKVDDHPDSRGAEAEREQTAVAQHVAEKTGDVVEAQDA